MVNIPACVNPFRNANEEISRLIPSRSLNVISICISPSFWNPKFLCFMKDICLNMMNVLIRKNMQIHSWSVMLILRKPLFRVGEIPPDINREEVRTKCRNNGRLTIMSVSQLMPAMIQRWLNNNFRCNVVSKRCEKPPAVNSNRQEANRKLIPTSNVNSSNNWITKFFLSAPIAFLNFISLFRK